MIVIISCYFNPQNNPYPLKSFYDSIKHLNHQIIECVIGDTEPQLPITDSITRVYTKNLLWHKESLLNNVIKNLDPKYKYVFWVDADVIFMNNNWLLDSVNELRFKNIVQPFEYCVHLEKDEEPSDFPIGYHRRFSLHRHPRMWRSFCANHVTNKIAANSENYDTHGHVGFAWGARREVLELCPLYDRTLVGGSDHIMAHAAAGHIPHSCIVKSFTDDIDAINEWSRRFYSVVGGSIGYAKGDLFHMWHGDLKSRQYLKRVQEFTGPSKGIVARDSNGLHVTDDDSYVRNYFREREVRDTVSDDLRTSMLINWVANNPSIDALLASVTETPNNIEFGGGDFGGAEGTWESSNDNIQNENFLKMTILCISDSHNKHEEIPKEYLDNTDNSIDTIIHAGDISSRGYKGEIINFLEWYNKLNFKNKIFIAGNHDFYLEQGKPEDIVAMLADYPNITYLNNSGIEIDGIKIWGSPVQPWFYDGAFNRKGSDICKHWDMIPDDTNLLITHGPIKGYLDLTSRGDLAGCPYLLERILNLKNLKLHLCGHIHEGYGADIFNNSVKLINASVLEHNYKMKNKPILIEI